MSNAAVQANVFLFSQSALSKEENSQYQAALNRRVQAMAVRYHREG